MPPVATLNRPPAVPFAPIRQPVKPVTNRFRVVSAYEPAGDQPTAIGELTAGLDNGEVNQVLLGVTGSGKTFTMAKVIERVQKPTLVLAPNKTLAAQLYGEMKAFFPDNAVEYFVSYYDYYQPEAYVPRTDTYIEKDSQINEQIDRMRHAATQALLERNRRHHRRVRLLHLRHRLGRNLFENGGEAWRSAAISTVIRLAKALVDLQYRRNDVAFQRGTFPPARRKSWTSTPASYEDRAWRVTLFGDEIEKISRNSTRSPASVTAVLAEYRASTPTAITSPRAHAQPGRRLAHQGRI